MQSLKDLTYIHIPTHPPKKLLKITYINDMCQY